MASSINSFASVLRILNATRLKEIVGHNATTDPHDIVHSNHIVLEPHDLNLVSVYCMRHHEDEICNPGFYGYTLSFAANMFFLVFFIVLCGFSILIALPGRGKKRHGLFAVALFLGLLCECLGYVGRLLSIKNQFHDGYFLVQMCTLTVGPAFLAAAVYLSLRIVCDALGSPEPMMKPRLFTKVFIPCDVVSLVLQATGAGLAGEAYKHGGSVKMGDDIMLAGLAFQLFTMFAFIICTPTIAIKFWLRYREASKRGDGLSNRITMRNASSFRCGLCGLSVASLCIFIRCVFRVIELSGGWTGNLMQNQTLFVIFESTMVLLAAAALICTYPILRASHAPQQESWDLHGTVHKFWVKPKDDVQAVPDATSPAGAEGSGRGVSRRLADLVSAQRPADAEESNAAAASGHRAEAAPE